MISSTETLIFSTLSLFLFAYSSSNLSKKIQFNSHHNASSLKNYSILQKFHWLLCSAKQLTIPCFFDPAFSKLPPSNQMSSTVDQIELDSFDTFVFPFLRELFPHFCLISMFTYLPGCHNQPKQPLKIRRQFHVAALLVLLTKTRQALKEIPEGFDNSFFIATILERFYTDLFKGSAR